VVDMAGDPEREVHGILGARSGVSGRVRGSHPLAAIIRIPDPNHEGLHLCAGISLDDNKTWRWFRLTSTAFGPHEVEAEACEEIRECSPRESQALQQVFDRDSFRLYRCMLKGDPKKLLAFISR